MAILTQKSIFLGKPLSPACSWHNLTSFRYVFKKSSMSGNFLGAGTSNFFEFLKKLGFFYKNTPRKPKKWFFLEKSSMYVSYFTKIEYFCIKSLKNKWLKKFENGWRKKKKEIHQNSNIRFLAIFEFFLNRTPTSLVSPQRAWLGEYFSIKISPLAFSCKKFSSKNL